MALKGKGETPRDYFNRIRAHHREKSGELKNAPIDIQLIHYEQFKEDHKLRCGGCNSSYTEDSISPYECKICGLKRMTTFLGEEQAKIRYKELREKQLRFQKTKKFTIGDKKLVEEDLF